MTTFTQKVYTVVKIIPSGKTLSYREVASLAGNPKAYRAVGNILNKNFDPTIPCHRVIKSDGTPGGYNRGADKKVIILKKENAL
jgi:O-6-methylguanine DNA methyltransferase